MTDPVHLYLRYLSSWDRDETGFHAALDELALRPVRFSGVPRQYDDDATALAAFMVDPMAAVTEAPDGTLLLPGNPHQLLRQVVEERFRPGKRPGWHRMPQALQRGLASTRRLARGRRPPMRLREPRPGQGLIWPDEPRVDRYRRALYEGLVEERFRPGGAQGAQGTHRHRASLLGPPWPESSRYAVAVTYEGSSRDGMKLVGAVHEENLARGVRPCFYLAPRRAMWDHEALEAVRETGGEVGLYGLQPGGAAAHLRPGLIKRLLARAAPLVERHEIVGHRSPTAQVPSPLLQALSETLLYDSSIPDTTRCSFTAARRGCAVTVPFWREVMLELPVTVPADTLLRDLGYVGLEFLEVVRAKIRAVARRHGLATLAIRLEPGYGGSRVQRDLLGAILEDLRDEGGVWFASPREVAALWREAAALSEPAGVEAAARGADHRL